MTNAPQNPRSSSPTRVTVGGSRARRDQLQALAVALFCFVAIALLQPFLESARHGGGEAPAIVPRPPDALGQLAVEFPRLTLGGFRGIIAPALWYESEDAKNERRWQDVDTYYNIIGKIEPYFGSVYIFNAWNQAYNLSAQWHLIDEKYQWVLEGLSHLYEGEKFNPDNADIKLEISHMYLLKLGTSFERIDYRKKWRDSIEHQYELNRPNALDVRVQEGHQRVRDFILRPQFNCELRPDPMNPQEKGYGVIIHHFAIDKDDPKKDVPLEYPYGLSPFYFAYIEYTRTLAEGEPTTMGRNVVDAYPAMSLRLWCRDDIYYSQSKMREMFWQDENGQAAPQDIPQFDRNVADLRICYANVQRNAPMAMDKFAQHLARFPFNESTHRKHFLESGFLQKIASAEGEMFEGLVLWYSGDRTINRRRFMTPEARTRLANSMPLYQNSINDIDAYLDRIFPITDNKYPPQERADFAKYKDALRERIEGVRALLALNPDDKPDFSFLKNDVVER